MPPSHETDSSSSSSDSLKNFDPEAEFEESPHEPPLPNTSIIDTSARQAIGPGTPSNRANPLATKAHEDADSLALFFSAQASIGVREEVDRRLETEHEDEKALGRTEARVSERRTAPGERISEHQNPLENIAKDPEGKTATGERISEPETEASVPGKPASITPPPADPVPSPIRRDFFYLRNSEKISNDVIQKPTSETDTPESPAKDNDLLSTLEKTLTSPLAQGSKPSDDVIPKSKPKTDTAESSAKGNGLLSVPEQTLMSPQALAFSPSSQQTTEQTPDQSTAEPDPPSGPKEILEEIFARTPKPSAPKTTDELTPEPVPPIRDRPSEELEVGPSASSIPIELQDAPIPSVQPAVYKQDPKKVSDGAEPIADTSIPSTKPAAPNQQVSDSANPASKPISPPPISPPAQETPKRSLSPQPADTPCAPKKTRTAKEKIQCEHLCAPRGKIPGKQCGNRFKAKETPFCYLHARLH